MLELMPDGSEKLNRLRTLFTEADSLGSEFVSIYGTCNKDYPPSHRNADKERSRILDISCMLTMDNL
jgi:hypothetical protein